MSTEPTVFVIDSDMDFRDAAVRTLRGVCPRTEGYASAVDFLHRFDPSRPGCLLINMALAGMSGLELYRRLVNRADGHLVPPAVYVSSRATVAMAVRAMQSGAVSFLEKPVRDEDLWESVEKALGVDRENRLRFGRQADFRRRLTSLSGGEREVLELIFAGRYNKEIAAALNLSVRTVEDRRGRLMRKLHISTVVDLVRTAMEAGILPQEPRVP